MNWSEITRILTGKSVIENDAVIEDISLDSRLVTNPEETLFFAVDGVQHDGHDFMGELVERGVRHFIVERDVDISKTCHFLRVENSISALQKLVKYHRSQYEISVIGITGSNGKTTTKEWLSQVLSPSFKLIKSPKSFNSQVGVPLSVWKINSTYELGIFEAGISQAGEMEKLAKIIQPTIGIFTTIGPAHDEGFENRAQKIREKALLFEESEVIICRKDNREVYEHLHKKFAGRCFSWSLTDAGADVAFKYLETDDQYEVTYKSDIYHFRLPFKFDIWVENALHVITTSLYLGLSESQIQEGLNLLNPVKMRLQVKPGVSQTYIIDDTYNNDLQGLEVALNFLKSQRQKERKTVILSDLFQTGLQEEKIYEYINGLLEKDGIGRIIGIGPNISRNQHLFSMEGRFYEDTVSFLNNPPSFSQEMILVKGARKFQLERIVRDLELNTHRTVLEINFESIIHNLKQYKSRLNPQTKLMVMVKAFAYGGGSLEIANLLQFHKVDYLGVAYLQEAINLRKNGIKIPIMVMSPDMSDLDMYAEYNLEPEVFTFEIIDAIEKMGESLSVHLKLETGMNRLGFVEEELDLLIEKLKKCSNLNVKAIFTHLSSSDNREDDDFTRNQLAAFERMYDKLSSALEISPMRHVLNSSGILRFPDFQYDMVRLGIGLYGYDPAITGIQLRPVSTLKSRVSQLKKVEKGGSIGYGRMGKADEDKVIAIVPIGYADGYSRIYSNGRGKVSINGLLFPTIGNVCMDMIMIDVTGSDIEQGDEVIIFGHEPTIQQLAEWAETIPYEILTSVSQRVKRVYISE